MHLLGPVLGRGPDLGSPRPRRRRPNHARQAATGARVRVRAGPQGPRQRGQHALAGNPQRLGRQVAADDRQEHTRPRPRRAHRDRRTHHQRRAAALHHRDRARQRLLQPLHHHRRPAQQGAAIRRPPRRRRARPRPRRRPGRPALRRRCRACSPSTPAARERWIDVYGPLSRGDEGLLGAATRRAEAHAVRLAAIYATLDCAPHIRLPHLEAALAVWHYATQSARWIFGDSIGDPTADEIWALAKTRPAGVTRTEVRDLFSRNKKAREIERALTVLEEAGRLQRTTATDGRGRPAETWRPAAPARAA